MDTAHRPAEHVERVRTCALSVDTARWTFADQRRAEIEAHWDGRIAAGATYFNGIIHLMHAWDLAGDVFTGRFLRTDFKSYIYWRETGFPHAGVTDAFGSALLRSSEGHVLLGRQREGNINAGLTYLPGGFIDARDAKPDRSIDIEASILRELEEETGLSSSSLIREPGFLLTFAGPLISIAVELRSRLPATALRESALEHLRADADPELADIVIVASRADLAKLQMPRYAAVLLNSILRT